MFFGKTANRKRKKVIVSTEEKLSSPTDTR